MPAYFQGLAIGLAYVAPIGMQNLFVINTALTQPRRRALLTALIVIFFDITLVISLVRAHIGTRLLKIINVVCGVVLIYYGMGLFLDGVGRVQQMLSALF